MNSIKRINKFQNYGLKKSVGTFWIVMIIVNIFAYILNIYSSANINLGPLISKNDLISIAGANIVSIFIFFTIYSIIMYHEVFALAISFGITRKDFL